MLRCPRAAGPGCGTRGRRRGPGTPERQAPPVWRAPEGPEAWLRRPWATARPGCGGRGRRQGLAGLRDRPLRAIRLACGDLAGGPPPTGAPSSPAPLQDQTALGTPAGPQTQTQQSGPEPFGSGPPSMLSGCRRCATANQHRIRRVSSARPPCRPCRSSRR